MGWAYKVAYDAYGSLPKNWTKVNNLNDLKAGDVLRLYSEGDDGHSIFITNVDGEKVTYADCNADSKRDPKNNCKIAWNHTNKTKSDLFSILTSRRVAPYELIKTAAPKDVTREFANHNMLIIRSVETGKAVCNHMDGSPAVHAGGKCGNGVFKTQVTADGYIGFQDTASEKWLSVQDNDYIKLAGNTLSLWECFTIWRFDGNYYLVSKKTGKLVQAKIDTDNAPLRTFRGLTDAWDKGLGAAKWERFKLEDLDIGVPNSGGPGATTPPPTQPTAATETLVPYFWTADGANISGGMGTVRVWGWALDLDNRTAKIEVHVYIGGPAGSGDGPYIFKADKRHSDDGIEAAYPGAGNYHAFDTGNIPTARRGTQEVYAYALSVDSAGVRHPLNASDPIHYGHAAAHKTVNILAPAQAAAPNYHEPQMFVDGCTGGIGTVTVWGWAYDRDSYSTHMKVAIWLDGGPEAGDGPYEAPCVNYKDISSHDAGAGQYFGFSITINTPKTGNAQVNIYPKNIDSAGKDTGLASGSVQVRNVNILPQSYMVSYNANGGAGAPEPQTKTANVPLTLSNAVPTRFGYEFRGWSIYSTGTDAYYLPGGSYTANESQTLYAVWQAAPTLALDAWNYGAVTSSSKTAYFKFVPSASGNYEFHSYAYEGNDPVGYLYTASGSAYISDDDGYGGRDFLLSYYLNAGATYYVAVRDYNSDKTGTYPVWAERKRYTVNYNANGGSGAPSNQAKTENQTLYLSNTIPTLTGYTFLGWSTSSSATSATYSAGGSYTANAAATLYAVWRQNTAITYVLTVTNGAGNGTYAAGATINISANAAPTGKVFDRWTATAGTIANATSASTTITMPASATTVTASYKDVGEGSIPPPQKGIFGTNAKWTGEWWHYLLFFVCFGFIWMWI
jgi:hypothetical protein